MPFIDEISIHLRAGKGGDGIVSWLHEKGKEFSGPAGGDGGRGGDVYARAVSDIAVLSSYRHTKSLSAKDGRNGQGKGRHGKAGDSLIIDLPFGTLITNKETMWQYDLTEIGKETRLLSGGDGGFGNKHFKNARNTKPFEHTLGRSGMEAQFNFELRLIADVGIIGLPNAGKSSLLNALTRAEAKVGPYAFTTLTPNLGVSGSFVLADVPGLIAGSGGGRGLGHSFLRHIKRTKIIIHAVASDTDSVTQAYRTIRSELSLFDPDLLKKPEVVVLTKTDLLQEDSCRQIKEELSAVSKTNVIPVSALSGDGLSNLKETIATTLSSL